MQRIRQQQQLQAQSAPLRMAAELGDVNKVRALVMAGTTDIDAGGKHGMTALHRAAERERVDVVRLLLQAGANHGKRTNRDGQTALMLAAQRGNCAICELLVQAGADVNARSSGGWDAIMFASARRHKDAVVLLARANGNVEHCSPGGVTATDLLAVWHGDTRAADRARHATHNSSRARQQLRLWEEERARQAAQVNDTAEQDFGTPSDSVGTPRSNDSPTQGLPPLPASPRDVESDVQLLLAASEEQKRQQEEARIDSLLQRSRQPLVFRTGAAIGVPAASTQLPPSPAALASREVTTAPPIATTDETAFGSVNSATSVVASEDFATAVTEPVRTTTATVRDQDHAERQAERRARIEAMRRELEASLGS
jgi:hypothetical protein